MAEFPDQGTTPPHKRLQKALYESSYKRLKKKGLAEEDAVRIAGEVSRRAAERTKSPEFGSQEELAKAVHSVCRSLEEGRSYYDLIAERPYLATDRIDRLVAAAVRVRPEVPFETAVAARKATALERLSGGLAVLFTAAALAALGIWYALAVGLFVSIGSEVYVQMGMPASVRRNIARYRLTLLVGFGAVLLLMWAGYGWLGASGYALLKGAGLAVFAVFVTTVVPGFTLAVMVGIRARRWRFALEEKLIAEQTGDPDR